jgi:carboxylate-amine ligase
VPAAPEDFTIGVEEEFLLVDARSRSLSMASDAVVARARETIDGAVEHELQLCQVETQTPVCRTLAEVRAELVRLRSIVAAAAAESGCGIAAAGTFPPHVERSRITPKPAYARLEQEYRLVAREQILCGCHVHVGVAERDVAIAVMNEARRWLPVVLALSANSPFWQGADSGYASFRTEVWRRWPLSGPPEVFASRAEYDETVATLVRAGAADGPARLYWDVRPSARYETLEFRVADVGLTVDDTVMTAGLVRALAATCRQQVAEARLTPPPRPELLRAAMWRAARYGLTDDLVDLEERRLRPAADLIDRFLELLESALARSGEREAVHRLVDRVLSEGTGAERQRRVVAGGGSVGDVVDFILAETVPPG